MPTLRVTSVCLKDGMRLRLCVTVKSSGRTLLSPFFRYSPLFWTVQESFLF